MTIRIFNLFRPIDDDSAHSITILSSNVQSLSRAFEEEGSRGIGPAFLIPSALCALLTVLVGVLSITLHLKNYRRVGLQRMVIRILLMPPLYAVVSLISLLAPKKAVLIDAGRDVYEAFVIYCFFHLLLSYLGGEREMLIMLHGREPKRPLFPMSLWRRELDGSDPYEWLWMKRGILQYVQIKPLLALLTLILKLTNTYQDGSFTPTSGYLLASFWVVVSSDLEGEGGGGSFRPVPKFLCVKGVLVLTFWQGLAISGLVEGGVITHLGHLTSSESPDGGESVVAVALTDLLVCFEMPLFAIAHMWAFSHKDFTNLSKHSQSDGSGPTTGYIYVARLTFAAAFWDCFSLKDVWEDTKATLKGDGLDYRAFEPSEGGVHVGEGLERRMRAGLRYTRSPSQRLKKYWLPEEDAPLLREDDGEEEISSLPYTVEDHQPYSLSFPSPTTFHDDEDLYVHARNFLFGDYNYPVVDVSGELARQRVWDEEERVLRHERGAWNRRTSESVMRASVPPSKITYGAVSHSQPNTRVIDFAAENLPSEGGGVRMAWTKINNGTGSNRETRSPPSRKGSPMIRSNSNQPPSLPSTSNISPRIKPPILPNDAVDLVVADETRRLRRVYSPQGEDHGSEPSSQSRTHSNPAARDQDIRDLEGEVGEVLATAPAVGEDVVKVSPPAYAIEEDNPWA